MKKKKTSIKIHEFLLTFFYSGKAKKAPGTFGSLASVAFWLGISYLFYNKGVSIDYQNTFWILFLSIILAYGSYASPIYAAHFKNVDHPSIVLDETLGQILTLQMSYTIFYERYFSNTSFMLTHLALSFVLFRLFDIKKPLLIGYYDRKLKNGFGVMFDDLIAGFVAGIISIALFWFC